MSRLLLVLLTAILFHVLTVGTASAVCVWEGKTPFCNGKCKNGFTLIKKDKSGDGKKCTTGNKAYCCPTANVFVRGLAPLCNGSCKVGEVRVGDSATGENGQACVTGKAAMCYNPN